MKVITIKQPFAFLIAEGLKEYEFRTWKTKYRGEILIHAGKGIDFSDSIIDGMAVSIEDIKGASINQFQAIDLLYLLGVKIKE